ncbi:hypothetical protein HELRODRAFT_172645 [Helobdella robusta]|uniref:Uncharacterized protein n=1 Tax=Helobdella robusta TaxID=6412 RepID=T1F5Q0_HELRO|nr:hypothetical protein HELRODRAFT_172645 [Helobdella robusta]ESO04288.1 hypothetical protein HELRODRAFT_172645 [Helobdella robusta]
MSFSWPSSYLLSLSILTATLLTTENGADGLVSVRRKGIRVRWPGPVNWYRCETYYTGYCRESPSRWWPCTGNYCYVLILDNSLSRYYHAKKEVEEECKPNTKLVEFSTKLDVQTHCAASFTVIVFEFRIDSIRTR